MFLFYIILFLFLFLGRLLVLHFSLVAPTIFVLARCVVCVLGK